MADEKTERRKMTEESQVSSKDLEIVENYLNTYKFCRRMLNLRNYEQKYFDTLEWESESPAEFSLARAKMYEIRHFILDMPNCDEKLLLYYHFVRCETVERCGELLGVSRSSAFRMKKRALAKAFLFSVRMGKNLEKCRF